MTIEKLKEQGHILLDEYIAVKKRNTVYMRPRKEVAYEELSKRMKGKNPHFSNMRDKNEIMLAIGTLKKMIFEAKNCYNT